MMLTTGAASPLVILFPHAFSGPSPFVSEVHKQPKVSGPPLEEDITDAASTPMVLVLSPKLAWDPLPFFSLNYKQACAVTRSFLHYGSCQGSNLWGVPENLRADGPQVQQGEPTTGLGLTLQYKITIFQGLPKVCL
ncbi:hypothetical protein DSO57_1030018 [Entomophthora muscae]|uniref:Uncharacterized protein n=1 Tax=Entomophthora muscae TaxID=34485 RepID=A0ACC2SDY4_9FUNG|nr:hypothetical protein DSO57_1030018 [Entomophthora muscae]